MLLCMYTGIILYVICAALVFPICSLLHFCGCIGSSKSQNSQRVVMTEIQLICIIVPVSKKLLAGVIFSS